MNEGDLAPGKAKHFSFGPRKGLVYNDDGRLKAYVNACTHMGGTTDLEGPVLRCRWHHAEFDPKTGARLAGQAPEGTALEPIELVIEGGKVFALWEIIDPFA